MTLLETGFVLGLLQFLAGMACLSKTARRELAPNEKMPGKAMRTAAIIALPVSVIPAVAGIEFGGLFGELGKVTAISACVVVFALADVLVLMHRPKSRRP